MKARPNKKWADLEGVHAEKENETAVEKPVADKPYYPSSSKTGPKDWDKLATELTAKPKNKGKGKEGETTGDEEYDSEDGGDPVNFFFKKLYKDADEDTRRAMMKSYTESNGTALSTNWGEVGQGKVETSPPGRLFRGRGFWTMDGFANASDRGNDGQKVGGVGGGDFECSLVIPNANKRSLFLLCIVTEPLPMTAFGDLRPPLLCYTTLFCSTVAAST